MIVLGLGGCMRPVHRHVDVSGSVEVARRAVDSEAFAHGMEIERERRATLAWYSAPYSSGATSSVGRKRSLLSVRFHALDREHTRIELSGSREGVGLLQADAPGRLIEIAPEYDGWSEWLGVGGELAAGIGVGRDPDRSGAVGQVDLTARIGKRLWRFGGVDDAVRARWALVVGGGVGVRLRPDDETYRAELSISLERTTAGWFVPWYRLRTGPRTFFELSIAWLSERAAPHGTGRHGAEVGLAVRRPPWGGIYVRAGALSDSGTARGGMIWSAGVEGGTYPSVVAMFLVVVVAAAMHCCEIDFPGGGPD